MTNPSWSPPTPVDLPPDHSATFHAWKALTEAQKGVVGRGEHTQALIDAVLANKPTGGVPPQLVTRSGLRGLGGARPARLMSGFGAAVATTAGKIALCTTVAAASVGGVYATTDRISLPEPARAPEVAAVDLAEGTPPETSAAPETPAAHETPAWLDRPDIGVPLQIANDHGQEIVELIITTDLHGCDLGQAVADAASQDANGESQNPNPDHDPCDRTREPNGAGQNSDESDEHPGQGRSDEASGSGQASESSGNPGRGGKPEKPNKDD